MTDRQTDRDFRIDYIKAVGIILMVAGHCDAPFTNWIYLFHMALFFIVSGYCMKNSYSDNLSEVFRFIAKRIKSLYMPCLIFNSLIVLLHNMMNMLGIIDGEIYSLPLIGNKLLKCVLFSGGESMSGAMWFLRTMFISLILYVVLEYFLRKICKSCFETMKSVLFLGFLFINWMIPSSISGYEYLNCTTVLVLYQIGNLAKYKLRRLQINPFLGILSFLILLCLDEVCNIEISLKSNAFYNPLVFLLCSVSGFLMSIVISNCIEQASNKVIQDIFKYIGRHTLPIVMLHFLCFKIVTLIQMYIYKLPIDILKAYPCYKTDNGWWVVYLVVGVLLPLVMQYICLSAKKIVCMKIWRGNTCFRH